VFQLEKPSFKQRMSNLHQRQQV